jgi:ABC-type glycerol-3-phosphate transport system substrate-binding protein
MSSKKLSRREILKLFGAGTAGALIVNACAPVAPSSSGSAGSAPDAADAGPATLTWWRWGGTVQSEVHDQALRSVYPELNDEVTMEFVVAGSGDGGVAEALRLALAAGQDIPDLVRLNRTQMAEFALAGVLTEVDEAYTPYESDMYAGALNLTELDGHYYAFPRQIKSKMFFYRGDIFDEMGITVEDIVTVADFINVAKQLNATYPDSYLLNLGPNPATYWMGMILSAYENARMAETDGTYMITSHPAFADMFNLLKDLYDSEATLRIDDFSSDWQQAFADEAIMGSLLSNWMKRFLPGFAPEQTGLWKTALWPELAPLADQRFGSEAGGAIVVVPKQAPNAQRAVDYATRLTLDKTGAMAIFRAEGETPLMKSAQPEVLEEMRNLQRPEDVTEDAFKLHPVNYFGPELMEMEFASYETVRIFPYDPSASVEIPILKGWLDQYVTGQVSLESALTNAQADMEGQIGNPYSL